MSTLLTIEDNAERCCIRTKGMPKINHISIYTELSNRKLLLLIS